MILKEIIKHIKSEEDTRLLAAELAKKAVQGTVYALIGDLGTGKTTFTKGFARELGVSDTVGSPTFKLVSEYSGSEMNLYHIDCYRLENGDEFLNIDGERFLYPEDGVTIIEWADRIPELLDDNTVRMYFERIPSKESHRTVRIIGSAL